MWKLIEREINRKGISVMLGFCLEGMKKEKKRFLIVA
jgi:hypothetical protein